MFNIVLIIYLVLTAAFLMGAALIFRHFKKFGYLSPQFGITVTVFGLIALIILGVSLYFLIQLYHLETGSPTLFDRPGSVSTSGSGIDF